jgi:hypothetical protein
MCVGILQHCKFNVNVANCAITSLEVPVMYAARVTDPGTVSVRSIYSSWKRGKSSGQYQ